MRFRIILLLLAGVLTTQADVTIKQNVEIAAANSEAKTSLPILIRVKDTHLRMDIGEKMSILMNSKNDGFVTLSHEGKMAIKASKQAVDALAKGALSDESDTLSKLKASDFKPTGKKDTIAGHSVEEYTVRSGDIDAKMWLAKDLPSIVELQRMMDQVAKLQPKINHSLKFEELPGFPLKQDITTKEGRVTTLIETFDEKPISNMEFEVPQGYRILEMPSLPMPDQP